MAFMRPVYTNEPFHVGETKAGERVAVPADVYGTLERFTLECDIVRDAEIVAGAWWCRLSAPGYMDATEWDGPHASRAAARASIESMWEVDPDTGDDLDDDTDDAGDDEDGDS